MRRFRRLAARRLALLGAALVFVCVACAVFGRVGTGNAPFEQDLDDVLAAPSLAHPLGTDQLGRDVLARILYGSSISLLVGLGAVALSSVPGTVIGLIVGFRGGWLDQLVMRFLDGLMAFPALVLALTIVSILGSGLGNVILAIAVASLPLYTRLTRAQVLSVREVEYVTAIRAVGASPARILVWHVLPNVVSPVIVQGSLGIGFAIIAESSLSFLGLGVQPPTPTWGSMIQIGFQYLTSAPWLAVGPAAAIFAAVLGFNLLGDGLREALDPRMTTG